MHRARAREDRRVVVAEVTGRCLPPLVWVSGSDCPGQKTSESNPAKTDKMKRTSATWSFPLLDSALRCETPCSNDRRGVDEGDVSTTLAKAEIRLACL